jgi:hypothetical protein
MTAGYALGHCRVRRGLVTAGYALPGTNCRVRTKGLQGTHRGLITAGYIPGIATRLGRLDIYRGKAYSSLSSLERLVWLVIKVGILVM